METKTTTAENLKEKSQNVSNNGASQKTQTTNNLSDIIAQLKDKTPEILESELGKLKKKGSNYVAVCPFHNEKTPSFNYNPDKKIIKCFGCGWSKDVIGFIIEKENLDFIDAVEYLCKQQNIPFQRRQLTDEEIKAEALKSDLLQLNKDICSFFESQLAENKKAKEYTDNRIDSNTQDLFRIGYAPGGYDTLYNYLKSKGYTKDFLLKSCNIIEKNGKIYDFFQNRIMFPLQDAVGNIIGFTGRSLDNSEPKYLNSKNSLLFDKSMVFFGLLQATDSIRKKDKVIIVEGPTDSIRLNTTPSKNAGDKIINSLAMIGKELTEQQIKILARLTHNVVIIPDMDKNQSGQNAAEKNAEKLLRHNFNVYIYEGIPENEDPDSYFAGEQYDEAAETLYPVYLAKKEFNDTNIDGPAFEEKLKKLANVIALLPEFQRNRTIENIISCNKIIKKQDLAKAVKAIYEKNNNETTSNDILPDYINRNDYDKHGFFVTKDDDRYNSKWAPNQYVIDGKIVTNFILEPLGHIIDLEDDANNVRNFKLLNTLGSAKFIKITDEDLNSAKNFKKKITRQGQYYLCPGFRDIYLDTLSNYWIQKSFPYNKIKRLGWQNDGFWAWSNGISTPEVSFIKIDDYGYVKHKGKHYFIEFESAFSNNSNKFEEEKRFKYVDSGVSLKDWFDKFHILYGEPAKLSFCFYLTSVFQDLIFKYKQNLPILNIFGEKGIGKTKHGKFLQTLYGKAQKETNLSNITQVRFAEDMARFKNSFVVLDEYKNKYFTDPKHSLLESLKGLYNKQGRKRMKNQYESEYVPVNSMGILIGQELPTVDPALTRRLIHLKFKFQNLSDEQIETESYFDLHCDEGAGFSNITAEILKHRNVIKENYNDTYKTTFEKIKKRIIEKQPDLKIEGALIQTYSIVIATFLCLENYLDVNIFSENILDLAADYIRAHNDKLVASNETIEFFKNFEQLLHNSDINNQIKPDEDFKLIKKYDNNGIFTEKYDNNKKFNILLLLFPSRIYKKIDKYFLKNNLDQYTLLEYLRDHNSCIEYKKQLRIGKLNSSGLIIDYYKFYKAFNLNLHNGIEQFIHIQQDIENSKQADEFESYDPDQKINNNDLHETINQKQDDQELPF